MFATSYCRKCDEKNSMVFFAPVCVENFDARAGKPSENNHATLKEAIAERHTSRNGFFSFYPNTLDAWPAFDEFDANHRQTLLIAVIRKAGRPHYANSPAWNEKADWRDPVLTLERDAEEAVSEYWGGNGGFDEFVNYEKLEAALDVLRAAKTGKE